MKILNRFTCVLFVTLLGATGCGQLVKELESFKVTKPPEDPIVPELMALEGNRTFESCDEIKTFYKQLDDYWEYQRRKSPKVVGCNDENSSTNEVGAFLPQEAGVQEDDKLQVGERHLFYLKSASQIIVVDRVTLAEVGVLDLGKDIEHSVLYLKNNRLVALSKVTASGFVTRVGIYDVSIQRGELPRLLKTMDKVGSYETSRLIGSKLILQTNQYLSTEHLLINGTKIAGVECTNVIVPNTKMSFANGQFLPNPMSSINLITAIDINAQTELGSIGAIGYDQSLYMTESNLYLSSSIVDDKAFGVFPARPDNQLSSFLPRQASYNTHVNQVKFEQTSGTFELRATGSVIGRPISKWAYKHVTLEDQSEALWVATTTSQRDNSLTALTFKDSRLSVVGTLHSIGRVGETIRAVRYVGTIAYIVTFEVKDPLYAIDISDPKRPRILSEIEMPGFSSMLYPMNENTLVGVGYDATGAIQNGGVKLSLFDFSKKAQLKDIDHKVFGVQGSSSISQWDSHGLYVNDADSLIGIPVRITALRDDSWNNAEPYFDQSGVIMQKVNSTGFSEVARYSHKDLSSRECWRQWIGHYVGSRYYNPIVTDIDRIRLVDDRLVLFSSFGVSAASRDGATEISRSGFNPRYSDAGCGR